MDVAVHQRTDTQRLQPNGPRVSFNRDVHVKRIGKRPNENSNYPIQTTHLQPPNTQHLRRELPADLSKESILKEAARVIAQAESVKCKAQSNDISPKTLASAKPSASLSKNIKNSNTIPEKFHSLPSRKKKSPKLVSRSVSDVSAKKSKKPSIFNLFSRKSDSNLAQIERNQKFDNNSNNIDRRLIRSKSDASSQKYRRDNKFYKLVNDKEEIPLNSNSKALTPLPAQLSPIIENSQKEDYFEEQFNKERRKSDTSIQNKRNDLLQPILNKPKSGNIGYTNNEELDLVPAKLNTKTSHHIKDTITSLVNNQNNKTFADMHSSQLPPEKPTLTKGLTVDGMVKRLSMERFSPPPTILGPAFSYTRPNERIIYAQIASDEEKFKKHETSPLHDLESFKYQTRDIPFDENKVSSHIPRSDHPKRSYSPQRIKMVHSHHNQQHHSPSPWRQLSPRNLSDDDEGLGHETKKYFEDDLPNTFDNVYKRKQSPSFEIPIIPVLRSSSPIALVHSPSRRHNNNKNNNFDEMNTLRHRREILESRIKNRRFGGGTGLETNETKSSTTFMRDFSPEKSSEFQRDYLSADRDDYNKFHKLNTKEVLNKYSPDRTHLDMIAPKKDAHIISGYTHTKYFHNSTGGGAKEIYRKETKLDENGEPYVRESRRRERIEPTNYQNSSPERLKILEESSRQKDDLWQSSLKRDKRQQRSFDKGDSGIENDIRKESFNGNKNSKWRKRTIQDDIKACELFIKKERFHTDEQHPQRKRLDFVYRERSIDDGSHFDPRLDKYPKTAQKPNSGGGGGGSGGTNRTRISSDTTNREKKIGSFERMRKLFATSSSSSSSRKKENQNQNPSVINSGKSTESPSPSKDRYMVKEDEMRSRYYEHNNDNAIGVKSESKISNIATRRRLSTPKASPLLKRTSSEKATQRSPLTASNSKETKAEKSGWFKSLERRSKSKSKNKVENTSTLPKQNSSTLRTKESHSSPPPASNEALSSKNLRFFGDTDLDSNPPTISRITSTPRKRSSISPLALNSSQTFSRSAYHLDRVSPGKNVISHTRSSSLQNLEEGTDEVDIGGGSSRRYHSRGRNLDDISESGSETEDKTRRSYKSKLASTKDRLDRSYKYDENKSPSSSPQKELSNSSGIDTHRPLLGPIKPARSANKKFSSYSKDRDRIPDSSGTEGESSLHSQRSVVYLHATTIGAIPQPYLGSRRRAVSRDDLRRNKQKPLEPMTRTVSRSVSMLAPWKPKHLSDGYEINYSQEQDNTKSTMTMPRSKKSNLSLSRDKGRLSREDMTLNRHSSSTSPSKSALSTSSYRNANKRQTDDLRKDNTLSRRGMK